MEASNFLDHSCIRLSIPKGLPLEGMSVLEYTGKCADIGRIQADGTFKIITEKEWATEALKDGRGIWYQGTVYFLEDQYAESVYYLHCKKMLSEFMGRLTEKDLTCYEGLYDIQHFHFVKQMISLLEQGIYSEKQFMDKVLKYMPKKQLDHLISRISLKGVAV